MHQSLKVGSLIKCVLPTTIAQPAFLANLQLPTITTTVLISRMYGTLLSPLQISFSEWLASSNTVSACCAAGAAHALLRAAALLRPARVRPPGAREFARRSSSKRSNL